jgi:hypothetical protein
LEFLRSETSQVLVVDFSVPLSLSFGELLAVEKVQQKMSYKRKDATYSFSSITAQNGWIDARHGSWENLTLYIKFS